MAKPARQFSVMVIMQILNHYHYSFLAKLIVSMDIDGKIFAQHDQIVRQDALMKNLNIKILPISTGIGSEPDLVFFNVANFWESSAFNIDFGPFPFAKTKDRGLCLFCPFFLTLAGFFVVCSFEEELFA